MNFLSMEYFLAVEKERNISKAAEKLYISQQALSAQISSLEKELGSPLFIRHVPLELTYAGEVFLRYANRFHQTYQAMQHEFEEINAQQAGLIKVGVAHTRGKVLMPTLIERFQEIYPHYGIELFETTNVELQKMLLNDELDVVIANFPETIHGIELFPFYNEEMVLLVPEKMVKEQNTEDFQEIKQCLEAGDTSCLKDISFVLAPEGDVAGKIGRQFIRMHHSNSMVKVQSSNIETLLELCSMGIGACFCPRHLVKLLLSKKQIEEMIIVPLFEEGIYPIRLGMLKKNYQRKIVLEFISFCRNMKF